MLEKFKKGELLVACDDVNKIFYFMEYLIANGFSMNEPDIETYIKQTKIPPNKTGIGFIRDMIRYGDVTDPQIKARYEIVSYEVFGKRVSDRRGHCAVSRAISFRFSRVSKFLPESSATKSLSLPLLNSVKAATLSMSL